MQLVIHGFSFDATKKMSSIELAATLGQQHKNCLRSIRRCLERVDNDVYLASQWGVEEAEYKDAQGKTQPMFLFNLHGAATFAQEVAPKESALFVASVIEVQGAMMAELQSALRAERKLTSNLLRSIGDASVSTLQKVARLLYTRAEDLLHLRMYERNGGYTTENGTRTKDMAYTLSELDLPTRDIRSRDFGLKAVILDEESELKANELQSAFVDLEGVSSNRR